MSILDNVLKNTSSNSILEDSEDWKVNDLIRWKGTDVDLYAVLLNPKGAFWMARIVWTDGGYGYREGEEVLLNERFDQNSNLGTMLNNEWWIVDSPKEKSVYVIYDRDEVWYKAHYGQAWFKSILKRETVINNCRYVKQLFLPEWYLK